MFRGKDMQREKRWKFTIANRGEHVFVLKSLYMYMLTCFKVSFNNVV